MPKFYYGWYIVAVAVLVYMLTTGSTYGAFGLLVLPVSAEFNLSRADMNTAIILLNLGNAVMAPLVGRALDRFSAKYIMMGSSLLFGLCLAVLGLSRSLPLDALVIVAPLALAMQGAGTMTMSVFVARWFQVQRGRAMALALMGTSFGSIIVAPIVGILIEAQGWRDTLLALAVAVGGLIFLLSFSMRDRPRADEAETGRPTAGATVSAATPQAPSKVRELLRMPQFWSIALSSSLTFAISQAVAISLVPLALGQELTTLQGASLVSAAGVAGISGKAVLAVVADKIDRVLLLTCLFGLLAVTNGALMLSEGYAALLCASVLLGLSGGAMIPAFYALLADRFGVASFGTVRGLMAPISAVLGLVMVRIAGEVFDRTGGYDALFLGFVVVEIVALALMFGTRLIPAPPIVISRAAASAGS